MTTHTSSHLTPQGLTEQDVLGKGLAADIYTMSFTPLKASLAARHNSKGAQKAFVKMLVEPGASGKVLGLHMVGEDAPEIIQVNLTQEVTSEA